MDVGCVAVVEFVGQPVFGAKGGLRQAGYDFFEGIGIVAEALAELPVEPLGAPGGVAIMPISA
jgi:hypothetical protein